MKANLVQVKGQWYDLEDACVKCKHAFPCTERGATLAAAYPQMGTQNLRACPECGHLQEWVLKKGKQGFMHSVDHDYKV